MSIQNRFWASIVARVTPEETTHCPALWKILTSEEQTVLKDLVQTGPFKIRCDSFENLVRVNMASTCCINGEPGYGTATTLGYLIYTHRDAPAPREITYASESWIPFYYECIGWRGRVGSKAMWITAMTSTIAYCRNNLRYEIPPPRFYEAVEGSSFGCFSHRESHQNERTLQQFFLDHGMPIVPVPELNDEVKEVELPPKIVYPSSELQTPDVMHVISPAITDDKIPLWIPIVVNGILVCSIDHWRRLYVVTNKDRKPMEEYRMLRETPPTFTNDATGMTLSEFFEKHQIPRIDHTGFLIDWPSFRMVFPEESMSTEVTSEYEMMWLYDIEKFAIYDRALVDSDMTVKEFLHCQRVPIIGLDTEISTLKGLAKDRPIDPAVWPAFYIQTNRRLYFITSQREWDIIKKVIGVPWIYEATQRQDPEHGYPLFYMRRNQKGAPTLRHHFQLHNLSTT